MTALDKGIAEGWRRHTAEPEQVAAVIEGIDLAGNGGDLDASQWPALFKLYFHVVYTHLADERRLRSYLARAKNGPAASCAEEYSALLAICVGAPEVPAATTKSLPEAALYARAAFELGHLGRNERSISLYKTALAKIPDSFDPSSPSIRELAIASNNIAVAYESLADRSAEETTQMLLCAHKAREFWQHCGTVINVERAEYRLAMAYLAAGDFPRALSHARACEALCAEHQLGGIEQFYASAALAEINLKRCHAIRANLPAEDLQYCTLPQGMDS